MIHKLISLIYPTKCAVCREIITSSDKAVLCPTCIVKWRKERGYLQKRRSPEHTDGLISLVNYSKAKDNAAKRMIIMAKDRRNDGLYSFFASELAGAIARDGGRFDAVAFVPRSPAKVIETGTDQSEEIARRLAKLLGIPFVSALKCTGSTEQKLLDKNKRYENARSRFHAARSAARSLADKRVLLFDDIITTGASLSACADILKSECGASRVVALTIASSDFEN